MIRLLAGVGGSILFPFWFWAVPAWVGASPSAPWATLPFEAACGTCGQCLECVLLEWATALAEPRSSSPSQGLHASPRDTPCLTGLGRLPRSWAISQHEAQQRFQQGNAVRQTIKWLRINNHNFTKWVYHFPPLSLPSQCNKCTHCHSLLGFFIVFWQQSPES